MHERRTEFVERVELVWMDSSAEENTLCYNENNKLEAGNNILKNYKENI